MRSHSRFHFAHASVLLAAAMLLAGRSEAQSVTGTFFEDLDGDGVQGPLEPGLDSWDVRVHGPLGAVPATTDATGLFDAPSSAGCRAVHVAVPVGWRPSFPDQSCPAGGDPVGSLRHGVPRFLEDNLGRGGFLYISLGDSIAAGVAACLLIGVDSDYVEDVAVRLECLAGGPIMVDNRAVAGWHSEDLLTPMNGGSPNPQFIPNVVAAAPDLVTISIGGNDFLNTEPGTAAAQAFPYAQADLDASFLELIRSRRTLQEIVSVLTSELPEADVELNTVYDNLADRCATTDFHAAAPLVWNQMLRSVAWGQVRPAVIGEVAPEFAHQDVLRSTCCGAQRRICTFDGIHPNHEGSLIIEEALVESLGGITAPAAGASPPVLIGFQREVARLVPTVAVVRGGTVTAESEALALDGTPASVDGAGGWLELSGFALPPGVTPQRVVVGVRYRTRGAFTNDRTRIDASFVDFVAPRLDFTGWDTETPLVGGSGTNGNIGTPSVVNALPNVPSWREVSALVTLNAQDDGRVTGAFTWPAPTAADIALLKVRVRTELVGASDGATVEVDGAWALVFGTPDTAAPTPGEVSPPGSPIPLRVVLEGVRPRLTWGPEPLAANYRVYRGVLGDFGGAWADPATSSGGCTALTTFLDAFPPDAEANVFWLVSAVSASGVEGPLGRASDGTLRSAAGATCP